MDKLVNFSQPIEAYNPATGEVAATELDPRFPVQADGAIIVPAPARNVPHGWKHDGTAHDGREYGWRIRNVIPAKPSTPSNEELNQRMEYAIRRHVAGKADLYDDRRGPNITVEAEFRSIVSDLPKPVDPIDPDWAEAEAIAYEHATPGEELPRTIAYHAIKRGRTLAAGGTAHE